MLFPLIRAPPLSPIHCLPRAPPSTLCTCTTALSPRLQDFARSHLIENDRTNASASDPVGLTPVGHKLGLLALGGGLDVGEVARAQARLPQQRPQEPEARAALAHLLVRLFV